jgi:cation diffusion facilitator family transporter
MTQASSRSLTSYAWLSIAAAFATMALKLVAWWMTGSVGLLSDALESLVNVGGATMALLMLHWAAAPPDDEHAYGHSKAEYFSSGFEGTLILAAAIAIAWTAIQRLIHPQPVQQAGLGLVVSAIATGINFATARMLLRAGRQHASVALEADGHHLMTDVWTSLGVLVGIGLVLLTGRDIFDPITALAVAINIIWTGWRLLREATAGLMDAAWPEAEQQALAEVLAEFKGTDVNFHAVRTRRAGARRFVSFHVLVPGAWTVQKGHELLERVEDRLAQRISNVTVLTHLEPIEDPASYADTGLGRHG